MAASPLSLLLLGSLRYLGRGWTFDDIEENTAISEEVHLVFFHEFIDYCSTILFDKHVIAPTNAEEATTHMMDYVKAGMPGCVSSTDATHIAMGCCPHQIRHIHKGFKLNFPSRTYNLSCNHRRRILYTTSGHPASWNDKTLQQFGKFMLGIYKGTIMDDIVFKLDAIYDGVTIKVKYQGPWNLVDNGYICWSTCIPPMKRSRLRTETRWSQWLESMRKDVECCFGILKGRFRILKSPIRIHDIDEVDKIWKTCCALHNWLLEIDGLDKEYTEKPTSEWDRRLGSFGTDVPFAVQRLTLSGNQYRNFDASGMGVGNDCETNENEEDIVYNKNIASTGISIIDKSGTNVVRKLSHNLFTQKLILHFDPNFKEKKISWPQRKNSTGKRKRQL